MRQKKTNNTTNIAYIVFRNNTSDYFIVDKELFETMYYASKEKYTIVFDVEYDTPKAKFYFTPLKNKPYNQNLQPIFDEMGIK